MVRKLQTLSCNLSRAPNWSLWQKIDTFSKSLIKHRQVALLTSVNGRMLQNIQKTSWLFPTDMLGCNNQLLSKNIWMLAFKFYLHVKNNKYFKLLGEREQDNGIWNVNIAISQYVFVFWKTKPSCRQDLLLVDINILG